MAMLNTFATLALASVMIPIVILIFRYAMKEKSYDERMAEQRKKLAEHSIKSKLKYQPVKKSTKKVEKERSHSEKKNKVVSSQNVPGKEMKKFEAPKASATPSLDKVDGVSTISKRKTEKIHSKNINPNLNVKPVADDDEKQCLASDDNNNQEKNAIHGENDDSSCNTDPVSSTVHSNDSTDNDISNNSIDSHFESSSIDNLYCNGGSNEIEVVSISEKSVSKNKVPAQNCGLPIEIADGNEKKSISSETSDKPYKKQNSKQENDNLPVKLSQKIDEKMKESKSKQKFEDREKTDGDKCVKENKLLASPSKNKKLFENNANKSSETGSDSGSGSGNGIEETKNIQDHKKEVDINIIVSESVTGKEECNLKFEKSLSPVAAKKQNVSVPVGNSGGKTSPVQGIKNQRQTSAMKNPKKQTTEIKTLQKLSNESNGSVNVNLLIPLLTKAELSHSEIQNLIDFLLNKQQENCTIDAEWIGSGRRDPIVKLKKQLAEKEKALTAEQEAHQAMQNKLKELRTELNNEKHVNRQREETLNSRQTDVQALNARLQAISEEKQNLLKQIQQLQSKLNEERIISRSLKEENSKTKNNLQQELLSQRQQLEMHIAHLSEQHQQTVMALEAQLGQVAARLQEQESANGQMTDEIVLLRERITVLDNQIAHYQQTHPATQDLMMQLEDLRGIRTILDRDLNSSQFEVNRLNGELRSMTDQLNRKKAEIEKFNCIITNMKIENVGLLKENSRNNEQINHTYNEKLQLQMEYDDLKKQLIEIRDKSNSSEQLQEMENTASRYRNMYNEKSRELFQLQQQVVQLKNSTKDTQLHDAEVEEKKKTIDELNEKLNKQLEKNEEIKLKEREEITKTIVKYLPNTCESNLKLPTSYEDGIWFNYLEKIFDEFNRSRPADNEPQLSSVEESVISKDNNVPVLDELEKQNRQLQTMVSRYKRIISETEGMLNSLQNHIEQEENRWSEQVRILSDQVQMMSEKVQLLQSELNTLSEERNCLLNKVKNIQNGCIGNDLPNSEQKLNSRVNKCVPLVANASINDTVSS